MAPVLCVTMLFLMAAVEGDSTDPLHPAPRDPIVPGPCIATEAVPRDQSWLEPRFERPAPLFRLLKTGKGTKHSAPLSLRPRYVCKELFGREVGLTLEDLHPDLGEVVELAEAAEESSDPVVQAEASKHWARAAKCAANSNEDVEEPRSRMAEWITTTCDSVFQGGIMDLLDSFGAICAQPASRAMDFPLAFLRAARKTLSHRDGYDFFRSSDALEASPIAFYAAPQSSPEEGRLRPADASAWKTIERHTTPWNGEARWGHPCQYGNASYSRSACKWVPNRNSGGREQLVISALTFSMGTQWYPLRSASAAIEALGATWSMSGLGYVKAHITRLHLTDPRQEVEWRLPGKFKVNSYIFIFHFFPYTVFVNFSSS